MKFRRKNVNWYVCEYCNFIFSDKKYDLKIIKDYNTGELSVQCPRCEL